MYDIPSIVGLVLVFLFVPKIIRGGDTKKAYKLLSILFAFNLLAFCIPMRTADWPRSLLYYASTDTPALLLPFFLYLITLTWILSKKKAEYSVLTFLLGVATMFYALFFAFNGLHPAQEPIIYTSFSIIVSLTLLVSPFIIFLLYINIASELARRGNRQNAKI